MASRLLFGIIGLTVALVTAVGMNILFKALNTKVLLSGTNVLLFETSDEITRRLHAAGARCGDPQFSLKWDNRNDLDLHVIDPAGNHIWFRQRSSPTGGQLDVDANACPPFTEHPVENVYWRRGNAPQGVYTVYVHHYNNHGSPDPSTYTLRIIANGRMRDFQGSLRHGEVSQHVTVDSRSVRDWYPVPVSRVSWATVVMGAWGAAIGLILAVGLRLPQAFFKGHKTYDRRDFSAARVAAGAFGGLVLGALAGALGQLVFSGLYAVGESMARCAGLVVVGGLLGYGLAHYVPNLPVNPARISGIIGGAVGFWAYDWALRHYSDSTGRWLVAALVGLAIGLMLSLHFWVTHRILVDTGGSVRTQPMDTTYRLRVNGSIRVQRTGRHSG